MNVMMTARDRVPSASANCSCHKPVSLCGEAQLEADPATTIALWHFDDGMGLLAADSGPAKLTATMPSTKDNQPKWVQIACVSQLPRP